jgi:glycosyltransferase involved in cell wall biosynthesis
VAHDSLVTIEENLDPQVRASAEDVTFVDSTCLYWYPAKRFPDLTLTNLRRVWDACVKSRAQVIHVTMCPSLPLFFICARALNIPLVISVHTDSVTLLESCKQPLLVVKLCKALEPLGTWFADATYTVSPSYSSILLQRGIKCLDVTWGGYANPAVFHPGAKDEEGEDWRSVLSFGHPDEFILITAGRVSPEKDIGFLVDMVKQSRAKGHKVWLAIIGDGPAAHEFAPLHGSEESGVWFVPGFMKQQELAQVYASVDVVASASTFETFGFTSLEAMACGTPFLGPRAQGFRDVVRHGKGGYLFDAKDQASAAHYLELLLSEKAELFPPERVLAATADFTAKNCLRRTLQAYQQTIARREASCAKFGCSAESGNNAVTRACMQALRTLPALFFLAFMALNWVLLNVPLGVQALVRRVKAVRDNNRR